MCATSLASQAPDPDFVIAEGKAGRIEVGMRIEDVIAGFGLERVRLVNLNKEGHFTPAIEIDVPGAVVSPSLVAEIGAGFCGPDFSVSGITVRDPRYQTVDGLRVGLTLRDLQREWPVRISREEGWWAMVPGMRISLGLGTIAGTEEPRVTHIFLPSDAKTVRERRCSNR